MYYNGLFVVLFEVLSWSILFETLRASQMNDLASQSLDWKQEFTLLNVSVNNAFQQKAILSMQETWTSTGTQCLVIVSCDQLL